MTPLDDDTDARELLSKVGKLASSLRGALNTYDAAAPGLHGEACTCEPCRAVGELRTYVRDLELAVSELERAVEAPFEDV